MKTIFQRFANLCVAFRADRETWRFLRERTAEYERRENPNDLNMFAKDWERYEELQAKFFTSAHRVIHVSRDREWSFA